MKKINYIAGRHHLPVDDSFSVQKKKTNSYLCCIKTVKRKKTTNFSIVFVHTGSQNCLLFVPFCLQYCIKEV